MTDGKPASIQALEADVAARRQRLAATVDELAGRVTPQALVAQQKEALRRRFVAATTTPEGELRVDRIAAVVAAVTLFLGLRIWSGRRRKRR